MPWVSGILGFASPATGLSKRASEDVPERGVEGLCAFGPLTMAQEVVCDHKGLDDLDAGRNEVVC